MSRHRYPQFKKFASEQVCKRALGHCLPVGHSQQVLLRYAAVDADESLSMLSTLQEKGLGMSKSLGKRLSANPRKRSPLRSVSI